MASKGVYVKGDKELARKLAALRAAGIGVNLAPAVDAGLLVIQNEITANAPYKTGNYKRSWHIGEAQVSKHKAYNTTGTDVAYAARLEFGFDKADSLGRRYHQAARPHVRPAFKNKRAEALATVEDAVRDIVEAAARS